MHSSRKPAVAGSFYPKDPKELRSVVRTLLHEVKQTGPAPKAMIAPHAGYIYSGPIAASAYSRLASVRKQITRVVLLGPAHRVALEGLAVPGVDTFLTPLGEVRLDKESIAKILKLPQVQVLDEAHAYEHSLEVHLPFLQESLDRFSLVPLVVGDSEPHEVAEVLETLWGGPETLIIISSDLSHYHDYQTAKTMDAVTSKAIETLCWQDLHVDQACGRNPINGLLLLAKKLGLHATTLDLRNSGDTAGKRDEVVGYGAYIFEP